MATCIRKALSADQTRLIRAITASGSYGPGAVTAVGSTVEVKHNLQLATGSDAANRAAEVLVAALRENAGFFAATWIDAMTTPLFCRYEPGMTYGDHVDAAMMGAPPMQMRCDLAVTVWLVDASTYDGGELIIDTDGVGQPWKGEAGDCLIYSADTLHRVAPVTRGVREVAVFWIQTMVRDEWQRRILFDLTHVIDRLQAAPAGAGAASEAEVLRRIYFNLVRRWA